MAAGTLGNICSGNGLLPDGTKQAITFTNVDLSSLRYSDVHLRAISPDMSQPSVTKISLNIIFLRFYWNLPGANELNSHSKIHCSPNVNTYSEGSVKDKDAVMHTWINMASIWLIKLHLDKVYLA